MKIDTKERTILETWVWENLEFKTVIAKERVIKGPAIKEPVLIFFKISISVLKLVWPWTPFLHIAPINIPFHFVELCVRLWLARGSRVRAKTKNIDWKHITDSLKHYVEKIQLHCIRNWVIFSFSRNTFSIYLYASIHTFFSPSRRAVRLIFLKQFSPLSCPLKNLNGVFLGLYFLASFHVQTDFLINCLVLLFTVTCVSVIPSNRFYSFFQNTFIQWFQPWVYIRMS